MKKIIKIVYCDLDHSFFPEDSNYKRTACEFLMGTNYVRRFLECLRKSGMPLVITEDSHGDYKVGYTIYLHYKNKNEENE